MLFYKMLYAAVVAISCVQGFTQIIKRNMNPKLLNKLTENKQYEQKLVYENYNEWADGEVPWDLPIDAEENETLYKIIMYQNNDIENNKVQVSSTREKIWLFLEELRWKARVSGALKGMYIQLGTGDTIMNELENFDNCDTCNLSYDGMHTHIENKMRSVNNYNTELEFLFTMATVISYQFYKRIEQDDLKKETDIAEYFRVRRQTVLLVLCILLIFTKNIKNAV